MIGPGSDKKRAGVDRVGGTSKTFMTTEQLRCLNVFIITLSSCWIPVVNILTHCPHPFHLMAVGGANLASGDGGGSPSGHGRSHFCRQQRSDKARHGQGGCRRHLRRQNCSSHGQGGTSSPPTVGGAPFARCPICSWDQLWFLVVHNIDKLRRRPAEQCDRQSYQCLNYEHS